MSNAAEIKPGDGRGSLPLVVGVVGHPDLAEQAVPALEQRLRELFAQLGQRYPHTPLLLLTTLAPGAERLAARVALASGIRLVVVDGPPADPESEDLRRSALCLPLPAEEVQANPAQQQAAARAHVVLHSQVLLALWDGVPRADPDDPYYWMQQMEHPADPADSGPVYHLLTPRQGGPWSGDVPPPSRLSPPAWGHEHDAELAQERLFRCQDQLNRDEVTLASRLAAERSRSAEELIPSAEVGELPASSHLLLERYALADALAVRLQQRRWGILLVQFALLILAVLLLTVTELLEAGGLLSRLSSAVLLALVLLLAWREVREEVRRRHLEYRALCEGLRLQLVWRLVGLSDAVADHFLRRHRSPLSWIRQALRTWALLAPPTGTPVVPLRVVVQRWACRQADYFTQAARWNQSHYSRLKRVGMALWGLVLVLVLLQIRLHATRLLELATAAALALAVAVSLYARFRAVADLARQYGVMGKIFADRSRQLQQLEQGPPAECLPQSRCIIRELGEMALEETAAWVLLHRWRILDIPERR
jgi:hypothetical protein